MNESLKLFMILLGRHIEQHDIFFTIGYQLKDAIPGITNFWPEANGNIHIDAWREVTNVDGYRIEIISNNDSENINSQEKVNHLFFINLGGYKKNEFEEFHYKMLAVAPEKGIAIQQAKQTIFYKHTGFKGATSHVDDKYGIDVDDVYKIPDILPKEMKEQYIIQITEYETQDIDELHLGYFILDRL